MPRARPRAVWALKLKGVPRRRDVKREGECMCLCEGRVGVLSSSWTCAVSGASLCGALCPAVCLCLCAVCAPRPVHPDPWYYEYSCVRDVVGKIDECTRRTAPKARWSLLRCGTSARNSLLPHRGGGREDKARGRTFDAHEEREGLSLSVQGPQGAERQQLVLVGATVPSASEEKGDTSGRLMDTGYRGRPTSAPKLPARVGRP